MKKLIFGVFFVLGILNNLNAEEVDILALVTNGKISDKSEGVRVLSEEEERKVVGGYYETLTACGNTSCLAIAVHNSVKSNLTIGEKRAVDSITFGDENLYVGYLVQKNWSYSSLGQKFSYFTYFGVAFDSRTGQLYRQSSQVLNNNLVVKQLSYQYKSQFDRNLGGLTIGY